MQSVREEGGWHEFDGQIPNLSPGGVRAMIDALGGADLDDPQQTVHVANV